mmetsp:Transcript_63582/g.201076  ORF Transcript_63582/g.201076 Transcript_63582/m.201076 type:complete len:243 (-) Transcript_63582:95-823(-)
MHGHVLWPPRRAVIGYVADELLEREGLPGPCLGGGRPPPELPEAVPQSLLERLDVHLLGRPRVVDTHLAHLARGGDEVLAALAALALPALAPPLRRGISGGLVVIAVVVPAQRHLEVHAAVVVARGGGLGSALPAAAHARGAGAEEELRQLGRLVVEVGGEEGGGGGGRGGGEVDLLDAPREVEGALGNRGRVLEVDGVLLRAGPGGGGGGLAILGVKGRGGGVLWLVVSPVGGPGPGAGAG